MKKPLLLSVLTLSTFLLALYGPRLVYPLLGWPLDRMNVLQYTLHRGCWWLLLPMLLLALVHGPGQVLRELRLHASPLTGLWVGLACTLPMLLGYALLFPFTTQPAPALLTQLYTGALWAGLGEEALFRGFLLGQLYRHGRWPLVLAMLVGAVFFASGHFYQGHSLGSTAGVLGITFAGALWFGWLLMRWQNLWVPVVLHIGMNAWWMLFEVADNAAGGLWANVFRAVTIGLSVWLTLRYTRPIARPAVAGEQPTPPGPPAEPADREALPA